MHRDLFGIPENPTCSAKKRKKEGDTKKGRHFFKIKTLTVSSLSLDETRLRPRLPLGRIWPRREILRLEHFGFVRSFSSLFLDKTPLLVSQASSQGRAWPLCEFSLLGLNSCSLVAGFLQVILGPARDPRT